MKNIAMLLLLAGALTLCKNTGIAHFMPFLNNQYLVHTTCNGIASIIAVAFLYRKFLDETTFRGEYEPDANVFLQTAMRCKTSIQMNRRKVPAFFLVILWSACSAIALNMLVTLVNIQSEGYEDVQQIQYSVPIWLGIILYGVVSPIVEEIVFRGLLYHRMKRYFSPVISLIVSAFMFGAFHGNALQAAYGMIMGILITLSYEWTSSFFGAVLFHMSANLVIYISSSCFYGQIQATILNCFLCSIISLICGFLLFFITHHKEKIWK